MMTLSISEGLAANLCERELRDASENAGVPLGLLYAIALTETGSRGRLSPYAMNIEGKTVIAKSRAEAMRLLADARSGGAKLVDLGCMQINMHYHAENFVSVNDLFDPFQNTTYAARFLKSLHRKHGSWTAAVARYHAGPNNHQAQKRYVCRVLDNLVKQGFGRWTVEAKAHCR